MPYTEKSVADKPAREELVQKYGRMATPTLVLGDRVFLGFRINREEIEEIVDGMKSGIND